MKSEKERQVTDGRGGGGRGREGAKPNDGEKACSSIIHYILFDLLCLLFNQGKQQNYLSTNVAMLFTFIFDLIHFHSNYSGWAWDCTKSVL
jgi:hypothetical protein